MTHWDSIYEAAIDNYGLITTAQAVALGVKPAELPRWVKTGRLIRRGHGVYRLAKYTPSDYDYYAEALAFTGDKSSIFGESVLAMQNLALVNPPKIYVAVGDRLRKQLPNWVQVLPRASVERPAFYQRKNRPSRRRSRHEEDRCDLPPALRLPSEAALASDHRQGRGLG